MALDRAKRDALVQQYADGPTRLRAALATVPPQALKWRPAPKEWSAHEIVVHCADSETNSYARVRFVVAEKDPLIQGYDQDHWATFFDYHILPIEPALAVVEAVRASTTALIRRLPEEAWSRVGRHTESGRYTTEDWLQIYADHLEGHPRRTRRADGAADDAGQDAGAEAPMTAAEPMRIELLRLEDERGDEHQADEPVERARREHGEAPHAERRAGDGADQEGDDGARLDVATELDEHREREHGRVDRQEHDRVGRRHQVGQERERDQRDPEAGEPHDEARGPDDEGGRDPRERHARTVRRVAA